MKETLSEKILNVSGCISRMLCEEDVKEFIKELKEDKCNCPICMKWKKRINRLAGEDLK